MDEVNMWRCLVMCLLLVGGSTSVYANKMAVPMDIRIDLLQEPQNVVRVQVFLRQTLSVRSLQSLLFAPSGVVIMSGSEAWQGAVAGLNYWQKVMDLRYQISSHNTPITPWKATVSGDVSGMRWMKVGEASLNHVIQQATKSRVRAGARESLSKSPVIR